jgi:hypothetical protein
VKKTVFIFLFTVLKCTLFSQTVNQWTEEMILWQCQSDPKLKLMYRVNLGDGGYNSLVELIVPSNIGTSVISGVLKVEENRNIDSYNSSTTKTESIKISQGSFDKQYIFNISSINQISFEGTCTESDSKIKVNSNSTEKYDFEGEWSKWTTLWEDKKDTIAVIYRIKKYLDEVTKKPKIDVEIQGPKNYSCGEVFIRGYIKDGSANELPKNTFILSESGKSKIFKLEDKDFNSERIILTTKKYKSYKSIKLKTKTAVIGDRG